MNVVHVIKSLFIISLFVFLSACSQRYVNQNASQFSHLACGIDEEECGITINNRDNHLIYDVKALPGGRYAVEGRVDVDWLSQGSKRWVEFYFLFLDEQKVVHEKKVKTISTNGSFKFEAEILSPVLSTSVTHIRLWTAS